MRKKIYLQLMAEGGAGTGASTGVTGSNGSGAATSGVAGDPPESQGDLSHVIYGKTDQALAQPKDDVNPANDIKPEDRQKLFENMIKKGGEWHEEFAKKSQAIIDKRFAQTKGLEEQLKSYDPIMQTLAAKYGVDAKDVDAVVKALENDTSLFEEQAFKEGLTPEQYRQKLTLERENAELRAAEEARKAQIQSEQIYSQWLNDAQALGEKYGREIDLAAECDNKDFTDLLGAGVQFEAAYKAIHADEMLNGAMAYTAQKVNQALANKAASTANNRPLENGSLSSSTQVFKTDVNSLTDEDMKEIARRAEAGERISF